MKLFSRLLCMLGMHGPKWYGASMSSERSFRPEPLVRECAHCGSRWLGEQVYGRHIRYIGNWRKVN